MKKIICIVTALVALSAMQVEAQAKSKIKCPAGHATAYGKCEGGNGDRKHRGGGAKGGTKGTKNAGTGTAGDEK